MFHVLLTRSIVTELGIIVSLCVSVFSIGAALIPNRCRWHNQHVYCNELTIIVFSKISLQGPACVKKQKLAEDQLYRIQEKHQMARGESEEKRRLRQECRQRQACVLKRSWRKASSTEYKRNIRWQEGNQKRTRDSDKNTDMTSLCFEKELAEGQLCRIQ